MDQIKDQHAVTPIAMAKELSVKLLIDTKENKVLFGEAGKEVVDFLFSLMVMPLGSMIKFLTEKSDMAGCITNIYTSITNLEDIYIQSSQGRGSLLNPKVIMPPMCPNLNTLLLSAPATTYYRCSYCADGNYARRGNKYTDVNGTLCPDCKREMNSPMSYVTSDPGKQGVDGDGGYVKGVVTYTIMDDLVVTPMSTISCIAMLNKFHVKDLGSLQEKNVKLSVDKALDLLKASLQSKTVLTDVFLQRDYDAVGINTNSIQIKTHGTLGATISNQTQKMTLEDSNNPPEIIATRKG